MILIQKNNGHLSIYKVFGLLILFFLFQNCGNKEESFRKYVKYDYNFVDTTLNYSLKNKILSIEFPNETEFNEWYLYVCLYTSSELYIIDSVYKVNNNQIQIPFDNLPSNLTTDSISNLTLIANQQKYLFVHNHSIVQKPFYEKIANGKLAIKEKINKLSLIGIDYKAWSLKDKELEAFIAFYDSLLKE